MTLASLQVVLAPESATRVRALALFPVLRGEHVTFTHGVDRASFDPTWLVGGYAPGSELALAVRGECADDRVQLLLVEIAGERRRPWDGGSLHITVSRQPWARSREANELLLRAEPRPLSLELRGRVAWRDVPDRC